jgi:hypothetical protein
MACARCSTLPERGVLLVGTIIGLAGVIVKLRSLSRGGSCEHRNQKQYNKRLQLTRSVEI